MLFIIEIMNSICTNRNNNNNNNKQRTSGCRLWFTIHNYVLGTNHLSLFISCDIPHVHGAQWAWPGDIRSNSPNNNLNLNEHSKVWCIPDTCVYTSKRRKPYGMRSILPVGSSAPLNDRFEPRSSRALLTPQFPDRWSDPQTCQAPRRAAFLVWNGNDDGRKTPVNESHCWIVVMQQMTRLMCGRFGLWVDITDV